MGVGRLDELSRCLRREVDIAVEDLSASEDLEVCFEIRSELVTLAGLSGMVMAR